MEVICVSGPTPGPVMVTVAHDRRVKQLAMEAARHSAGGWRARVRGGDWGVRCRAVTTAVLLEASEAFIEAPDEAPMHLELAAD
jgi:hypothetical protein